MTEYPYELFLKIEGETYKEVRLTINKLEKSYMAEIDIVFVEGRKIFAHLDSLYNYDDEQELVDSAVQSVSSKLRIN